MAAPPGADPCSTLVINLTGCLLIGGAVGAVRRYAVGPLVLGHSERGTFAVNVAGWLILGLLAGLGTGLSGWLGDLVGVGFCGALTTWSTFARWSC